MARRYWLFKSEPAVFGYTDLEKSPGRTARWDGVRNYQARNFLRDQVKLCDGVLFHHSSATPSGLAGIALVVRESYPDPTAFDQSNEYFDAKSDPAAPRWYSVDVQAVLPFPRLLPFDELRTIPALREMLLLRRGQRLSIQPVTPAEWRAVLSCAKVREPAKTKRGSSRARSG